MKSSVRDKVEGTVKTAVGQVKEKLGRANRDPIMQDEGMTQKMEGKIQNKVGDIKKVFNK